MKLHSVYCVTWYVLKVLKLPIRKPELNTYIQRNFVSPFFQNGAWQWSIVCSALTELKQFTFYICVLWLLIIFPLMSLPLAACLLTDLRFLGAFCIHSTPMEHLLDSLCLSVYIKHLKNGWMGFQEIWYGYYATEGLSKYILFNFLQLLIPTWWMLKQTCHKCHNMYTFANLFKYVKGLIMKFCTPWQSHLQFLLIYTPPFSL